jgi:GNAT superfamily N-acetyltransferase
VIASKLSQLIKAEIERYLADPNPLNLDPRPFVELHNVLPLLADWNGFFGLRPNGDVLVFLYDDGVMVFKLETDTRIRRVAFAQGAKTYAWLVELIPPRPSDAVDCSVCGGTGQIQAPGILARFVVVAAALVGLQLKNKPCYKEIMTTEQIYRQANPADAEAIATIVNAAFRVERFFIDGERTNPEHIRTLLQTGVFLLAEESGQLIGCVYVELRGTQGYFGLLAIDPERQKTGLGKRLVAAAEAYCRAGGCREMELQIVNVREELPGFYQRLGYRETGIAPFKSLNQPKIACHFVKMAKPL